MRPPHAPKIRAFLRANPDGATVADLRKVIPAISKNGSARGALERMPDAYIDRWVNPVKGQWQAVWCVIIPPRHCPYPTDRFKPETRWVEARI